MVRKKLILLTLIILKLLFTSKNLFAEYIPTWPYENTSKERVLNAQQTLHVESIILLSQLQSYQSVKQELTSLLKELQFEIVESNFFDNIELKKIPKLFQMNVPLNYLLKNSGRVFIQIVPQNINGITTSYAEKSGIYIDLKRFLVILNANILSVVPHEVTHFFHINNIGPTGPIDPFFNYFNTEVAISDPQLYIYKKGFRVTEIEAHLSDGILFKTEDSKLSSQLDSLGKLALSYIMADHLEYATQRVRRNIADYESHLDFAEKNKAVNPRGELSVPFLYSDRNGQVSTLIFNMPISGAPTVTAQYANKMLSMHIEYVSSKKSEISKASDGKIRNLRDAENLLRTQMNKPIHLQSSKLSCSQLFL